MRLVNILYPVSWIRKWFFQIRRFCYAYGLMSRFQFKVPVVSIGSLTSQKNTAFVLWLGQYINSRSKKLMILTRGESKNSFGILKSNQRLGFNPFEYGEEALLLSRRLANASIVIGRKKADNLEFYFEKEKPDVVLLDEGHRYIQLNRRLNIVLLNASMPIEDYKVSPVGFLTEGLGSLKEADAVILSGCDFTTPSRILELKSILPINRDVPVFEIKHSPVGFFDSSYRLRYNLDQIKNQKVICLTDADESFVRTLESLKSNIVDKISLTEKFLSITEAKNYLELADQKGSLLIMSEKNMVKMRKIVNDERILYLEVQVEFLSGEDQVKKIIDQVI